jgi:hypothetical protein
MLMSNPEMMKRLMQSIGGGGGGMPMPQQNLTGPGGFPGQ